MTTASAKELREAAQLLTELAGDARSVKAPKIADTNELAAALCIERAEQMERGEQSFSDWLTSQYSIIDMAKRAELKAAWHAATAQMQAKLDAAKAQLPAGMQECTIEFRACPVGHGRLMATNWTDSGCLWCALAAAQKRVAELEKQLEREYIRTRHARAQTEVRDDEIESLKGALYDYERMVVEKEKKHPILEAALATTERERDVLRGEVRRLDQLATNNQSLWQTHSNYIEAMVVDRPAEVRALVGTTADIKDT